MRIEKRKIQKISDPPFLRKRDIHRVFFLVVSGGENRCGSVFRAECICSGRVTEPGVRRRYAVGIYLETDGVLVVGTGSVMDISGEERTPSGRLPAAGRLYPGCERTQCNR